MFDFDSKFGKPVLQESISVSMVEGLVSAWKPKVIINEVVELSGGYSNSNFKIDSDLGTFVCRVSHKGKEQLLVESELSNKLGDQLSPNILFIGEKDGYCFSIVDFVEGVLFSEAWQSLEQIVLEEILIDLGNKISRIHSCQFPCSGFFDSKLSIGKEFKKGVGSEYYDFIVSSLKNGPVIERLGIELLRDIAELVTANKVLFEKVNTHRSLVHSDFNTKNILVSVEERRVTGILDWEYAHSGTPLCDFANFLRFEAEAGFNVVDFLVKGYGKESNIFFKDWRKVSSLLDLASMFGFLARENLHELTLNTSRKVIQDTISSLAVR